MNLNKHLTSKDIIAIQAHMCKKYAKEAKKGKCGKKVLTELGAMYLLSKIRHKRETGKASVFRAEKRHYYCDKCKGYHLTSEEKAA